MRASSIVGRCSGCRPARSRPPPFTPARRRRATVTWKCVANTRLSRQFTVKWKWLADEMGERTKGRMKFDVVSFPELGMTGTELIRVLNAGILDAGEVVTGYVSGEVPIDRGRPDGGRLQGYRRSPQGL